MSRLTADQESRGVDADCGVGMKGSVMRVNLTEGCGPVNDEPRRLVVLVCLVDQINQTNRARRRVVLVQCFSV